MLNEIDINFVFESCRIIIASQKGAVDPASDGNRIANGQLVDAGNQMPRTDQFQVSWSLFSIRGSPCETIVRVLHR